MNTNAKMVADQCLVVFEAAETVLASWDFQTKNLQFVDLVSVLSQKLNISGERDIKQLDGLARYFVHHHPEYTSKRGAGGGVTLTALENQKRAAIEQKKSAKAAAVAALESKLNDSVTI